MTAAHVNQKGKYPCIEARHTIQIRPPGNRSPWTVRIWREEETISSWNKMEDVDAMVHTYVADVLNSEYEFRVETLIDKIAALPRINAIEICDCNGHGVVVYVNWP